MYVIFYGLLYNTIKCEIYKCTFVDSRNSRSTEVKSASVYARKLENLTNNFYRINFFFSLSNLPCTSKASRYFSSVPWIIARARTRDMNFLQLTDRLYFIIGAFFFFFSFYFLSISSSTKYIYCIQSENTHRVFMDLWYNIR